MRLSLSYSGGLKSGAFVEIRGDVNSEELQSTLEFLDEHVDLQEPLLPDVGIAGLFDGDPDFGGTIHMEGSDPTEE